MRGLIHHLDLTVKDPWASRAFYDSVLGFMGYRLIREDARGFDWELTRPDGGFASIGLMKAEGRGP
jgi:catechol 2,3-dioxygenase-like lactoylglutathione lyase family enzyme